MDHILLLSGAIALTVILVGSVRFFWPMPVRTVVISSFVIIAGVSSYGLAVYAPRVRKALDEEGDALDGLWLPQALRLTSWGALLLVPCVVYAVNAYAPVYDASIAEEVALRRLGEQKAKNYDFSTAPKDAKEQAERGRIADYTLPPKQTHISTDKDGEPVVISYDLPPINPTDEPSAPVKPTEPGTPSGTPTEGGATTIEVAIQNFKNGGFTLNGFPGPVVIPRPLWEALSGVLVGFGGGTEHRDETYRTVVTLTNGDELTPEQITELAKKVPAELRQQWLDALRAVLKDQKTRNPSIEAEVNKALEAIAAKLNIPPASGDSFVAAVERAVRVARTSSPRQTAADFLEALRAMSPGFNPSDAQVVSAKEMISNVFSELHATKEDTDGLSQPDRFTLPDAIVTELDAYLKSFDDVFPSDASSSTSGGTK